MVYKKFLWSDIGGAPRKADMENFSETLTAFSEINEITAIHEKDFIVISGICEECGRVYNYEGYIRDIPDSFCSCRE